MTTEKNTPAEAETIELREAIKAELRPLIAQARKERKLLITGYQSLAFTPTELEKALAENKFVWGRANWRAEPFMKRINAEVAEIERLVKDFESFCRRIQAEWPDA